MVSDFISELKSRVDIVDVVGQYVELKKAGRNFKGLSPFKNEKTPSFMVNPERQFAYCFSSNIGGDVIRMTELLAGVSFREAVKILAERAGLELPADWSRGEARGEKKERLLEIHEKSVAFFISELEKSKEARDYLAGRGLTAATIQAWQIGFAPADFHALHSHLESLGYTKAELIESGMASARELGSAEIFDRFRGRIMFPIADGQGRVVAFTARSLDGSEPKYLNSPETPIFHKSAVLFGLHFARQAIRESKRVVLAEGQMDVIACHQAGFTQVVASSGTAVTETHFLQLKNLADTVLLCFDGDEAGIRAQIRAAELAAAADLTVRVVAMPGTAKDPDEAIQADRAAFAAALDQPLKLLDFYFQKVFASYDFTDSAQKKKAAQELQPIFQAFASSIEREEFLKSSAIQLGITQTALKEEWQRMARPQRRSAEAPAESAAPRGQSVEETLIGVLFAFPDISIASQEQLRAARFADAELDSARARFAESTGDVDAVLAGLEPELQLRIQKLLLLAGENYADFPEPKIRQEISTLIERLAERSVRSRRDRLKLEIALAEQAGDGARAAELFAEYSQFSR